MSLWNNKLEFSIEGYIKDTKDMLSEKNISLSTGYGALTVNDGELRTTGMEMQLIYHGNAGKDFKYDLDFNLSHFKSKLKSMADPNYMYEYGASRTYVVVTSVNSGLTKPQASSKMKQKPNFGKNHTDARTAKATGFPCSPTQNPVTSAS